MKTVFTTLIFILSIGFSFGQASVKSAKDLTSIKETGICKIKLPSDLTKEFVDSRAKYYPLYFTVSFDEATDIATIKMTDNTSRSRAIIIRFLAGCNIQTIKVEGKEVSRDELFENYLK